MIHLEPVVLVARAFSKGKSYGDEYRAVMTITKVGSIGYCSALMGKLRADDFDEMLDILSESGITELIATRHGKEKRYKVCQQH